MRGRRSVIPFRAVRPVSPSSLRRPVLSHSKGVVLVKLLRAGAPGQERPAVRTDDGRLLDLSSVPPGAAALGLSGTPCLRPGDTAELEIDGFGGRRQSFAQA